MKNEDIIVGETYKIRFNRKVDNCRNCSKIIGFLCDNCFKKSFDGIGLCIANNKEGFAFLISDTEMAIISNDCVISISSKKFKIRRAFLKNFLKKLK